MPESACTCTCSALWRRSDEDARSSGDRYDARRRTGCVEAMDMPLKEYHFVTRWHVKATAHEIAAIAKEPPELARVRQPAFHVVPEYRTYQRAARRFHWPDLPKRSRPPPIRAYFRIRELVYPEHCTVQVWGDLEGCLRCDITQEGNRCRICFDWRVRVHKSLLRYLSFPLKPVFYSNHLWEMMHGCRSLTRELERRRSSDAPAFGRPAFEMP